MGIYNNTVNKIWSGFSRCRLQLDFVSLFLWGILANFTARQAVANVCTLHSIFSFTRQSSLFSSTRRRLRVLSHHHVALLAWISGSRQWLEIVMATFPPPPRINWHHGYLPLPALQLELVPTIHPSHTRQGLPSILSPVLDGPVLLVVANVGLVTPLMTQ